MKKSVDVLVIGGSAAGIAAATTRKAFYADKSLMIVRKEREAVVPCGIPYIFGTLKGVEQNVIPNAHIEGAGVELVIDEVVSLDRETKTALTANGLEISFDRKFIVTASSDGKVAILDKDLNNQKIFEFGSEILSANISPENKKIAVGKPDRTVDVIDINSGETLYSIDGLKAPVISLAFSNEDILITASSIKTPRVNIWKNGHLLRKWIQTVE